MKGKETIFTTITRLANEHNAVNLGQGFPNFDPDPRMVEIIKSIAGEKIHQYAPMPGNPKLMIKIMELTQKFYSREISPENILITAGATQAIFTSILALVNKGDEVIIFDPAYDCYDLPVELAGAKSIHLNLTFPDYRIDWDLVRSRINEKTSMIILNNPHNPSGAVFDENDIKELVSILEMNPNVKVLSDEVYEYISFSNHFSLNKVESIRDRCIMVSSFGKTLHLTGWKIGYLVASKELMSKIKPIHQFNVFSVNSLSQEVIARFLDFDDVRDLSNFFQDKRDLFLNSIKESSFEIIPTGGTYFQLLSYKNISDISDSDMALQLIKENGIASIPVSGFYHDKTDNKVLRFCYGKDDETLLKAARILCQI